VSRAVPNRAYCKACDICNVCNIVPAMTNEQFKAGRLRAGLTQKQAAAALAVSQPYLSQLETGHRPVTPELARSAATL